MPILNIRQTAFLKIFLTTILWGSSYVLVKMGLKDLGPLMLAGMRYSFAGLLLVPVLRKKNIRISDYKNNYWQLALLGILSFTIGNGFFGFALKYLPSTTVSFISNLTTPVVLLLSVLLLKEIPKSTQIIGVVLSLIGLFMYFSTESLTFDNPGYTLLMIGTLGFTFYIILGRSVARTRDVPFLVQTAVPFLIGGGFLLILALIFEGIPILSPKALIIVLWMTLVNSIIGYLLYNQALTELTAVEVNVVMKLSPFFNAIFAWFLLGEKITFLQICAMGVVFLGVYLVQVSNHKPPQIP